MKKDVDLQVQAERRSVIEVPANVTEDEAQERLEAMNLPEEESAAAPVAGIFYSPCPWEWCGGDEVLHEMLCMASRHNYGVSWAHTHSHKELMKEFGLDIWQRDKEGNITGLKPGFCHNNNPR